MAFINGLKRAFGFSSGDYEEDFDDEEYESAAVIQRPINTPAPEQPAPATAAATPEQPTAPEYPTEVVHEMMEMLSESLPSWASASIDHAAMEKQVWTRLQPSIEKYADNRIRAVIDSERAALNTLRSEAEAKIRSSEESLKTMTAKADEIKSQLMSIERQKSAISQRTRDLENKVATAEAENEQFRLENKSLMNKLKVVQAKSEDGNYFKAEVDRLTAELDMLKANAESADAKDATIAELKRQLKEKDDALIASKNRDENDTAARAAEFAELKKNAEGLAATSAQLQSRLVDADNQLAEMKEKLRLANEEIQLLQDENAEAKENRMILQRIEQDFEILESKRKESERRAAEAQSHATEANMLLAESERKIASLNQRIAEIERAQSLRIKEISQSYEKEIAKVRARAVKAQSEAISSTTGRSTAKAATQPKSKAISIDIDEIDDISSGDWLRPMTVENAPSSPNIHDMPITPVQDSTPAQSPIAEDPRQMSLF